MRKKCVQVWRGIEVSKRAFCGVQFLRMLKSYSDGDTLDALGASSERHSGEVGKNTSGLRVDRAKVRRELTF